MAEEEQDLKLITAENSYVVEDDSKTIQETQEKSKKATKKKNRKPEELMNVTPGKMSDEEKKNHINYLREQLQDAEQQAHNFAQNAQSAYNKLSELEQRYNTLHNNALRALNFNKQAISTCYQSILMAGNFEE